MYVYGISDKGLKREINEDSFGIFGFTGMNDDIIYEINPENDNVDGLIIGDADGFCIIADGMGGHESGEVASGIAVEHITEYLSEVISNSGLSDKQLQVELVRAVMSANAIIYKLSGAAVRGMGTTLITVVKYRDKVHIANVGDSRVYLVENESIQQLTTDHSIVNELIQQGTITREEAMGHPQRNVITRALGTDKSVLVDVTEHTCKAGDIILLCTDGLTELVSDEEIHSVILKHGENIVSSADELVRKANENGGRDNITVILMRS